MITMGARGYRGGGSGGEIAIYWGGWGKKQRLIVLLKPSKFSYWLFNTWNKFQVWRRRR